MLKLFLFTKEFDLNLIREEIRKDNICMFTNNFPDHGGHDKIKFIENVRKKIEHISFKPINHYIYENNMELEHIKKVKDKYELREVNILIERILLGKTYKNEGFIGISNPFVLSFDYIPDKVELFRSKTVSLFAD